LTKPEVPEIHHNNKKITRKKEKNMPARRLGKNPEVGKRPDASRNSKKQPRV